MENNGCKYRKAGCVEYKEQLPKSKSSSTVEPIIQGEKCGFPFTECVQKRGQMDVTDGLISVPAMSNWVAGFSEQFLPIL